MRQQSPYARAFNVVRSKRAPIMRLTPKWIAVDCPEVFKDTDAAVYALRGKASWQRHLLRQYRAIYLTVPGVCVNVPTVVDGDPDVQVPMVYGVRAFWAKMPPERFAIRDGFTYASWINRLKAMHEINTCGVIG